MPTSLATAPHLTAAVAADALEHQARTVRVALLEILAARQVRPEIAALALADVLALQAASVDLDGGTPQALEPRLEALCQRITQTYRRAYADMGARRQRDRVHVTRPT